MHHNGVNRCNLLNYRCLTSHDLLIYISTGNLNWSTDILWEIAVAKVMFLALLHALIKTNCSNALVKQCTAHF